MLGRFNKVFGIQESLAAEQTMFVQRINQTAFKRIEDLSYPTNYYESIFKTTCYWLGINAEDRISRANSANYADRTIVPSLRSLTQDDFTQTLGVIALLHKVLKEDVDEQKMLSKWVKTALSNVATDLGIGWKAGMFYPAGAKELDLKLVEEPLEWLNNFPDERKDYFKALTGYTKNPIDEVIGNCYLAIEGIVRKIMDNKKTLDNNREGLIKVIGLSQEWKTLLSNFIQYANEFKRHASGKRHSVNPIEVEGFLYMTGLLIRMIVKAMDRKKAIDTKV